jgi:hypothetical protein
MTDRELRDLTGGAARRELQPLETDTSLFTELRGRNIGKDPSIKTQGPKGPVVHYGKSTLDGKGRSSSTGRQPSTADAMKAVALSISSADTSKTGSKVSFDTQSGLGQSGARRNSISIGSGQRPGSGEARATSPSAH